MKRHKSFTFSAPKGRDIHSILSDPMKREELALNKNRISEVSDWLDRSKVSRGQMLLLSGPAGCGKTACVRVLACEKRMQVIEWSTPIDSFQHWNDLEYMIPLKVSLKFKEFLLGVGRYSSVINDEHQFSDKKLIIIKDFPTIFFTNPEEFREIISEYALKGHAPIVFICTESPNKKSKDIAYELFPEEFKIKLGISQLSFLPVPVTSVVKALKRVVQQTSMYVKDETVKEIAQECRGDIRKALNDLKLSSVCPAKTEKTKPMQKKLKRGEKSNSNHEVDSESTGLFHTVGRILYAKRSRQEDNVTLNDTICDSSVGELVHKPEDIVKQFSHYANQVVSLAHSNYFDIFSSIDCIAKAAEYLSDADILMSEWREKDALTSVGFSVAVAGLMESNKNPIRKFRPVCGSKWNEDLKIAKENHVKMHALFSEYCSSRENICLEVIPFLRCMWKAKLHETASTKQCRHGFLPHKTDEMYCTLSAIKSDVLSFSSLPSFCSQSSDDDSPIHISDDSD